jgi:hypothetical protein
MTNQFRPLSNFLSNRRIGYVLVAAGALLVFAALLVDVIGLGKKGLQAAQIGGILLGVLLALIGWGLRSLPDNPKTVGQFWVEKTDAILNFPVLVWVLTGFILIFAFYFVRPMFFDDSLRLSYFVRYIPALDPIGNDLNYNTSAISLWLQGKSPYELEYHFYPPLYHVVFAPIILFGPEQKYALMTGLTLVSFGLIFLLPWRKPVGNHAVFLFFFLTGLVSYGMQFELERGQFNVLALLLALVSVWLFYNLSSFRLLAYALLTIAAHIKVYPGIFILMFFSRQKDWKENLKIALQLGSLNVAAFLVLGYRVLVQFVESLMNESGNPLWVLPDKQPINHSVNAFLDKLAKNNDNEVPQAVAEWIGYSAPWLEFVFLAIIVMCGTIIIWRTLRNRPNLLHSDALMLLILLGLLLPSVSIDYKLELLAPGLAVVLVNHSVPEQRWQKLVFAGIVIVLSAAYSLTLVPYEYRTGIIINAFPMLFTILLGLTGLNLLNKTWKEAL